MVKMRVLDALTVLVPHEGVFNDRDELYWTYRLSSYHTGYINTHRKWIALIAFLEHIKDKPAKCHQAPQTNVQKNMVQG